MSKYGDVAVNAAKLIKRGIPPRKAYEKAALEMWPDKPASREKGCPLNAFLGLYTNSQLKNAEYARSALSILRSNPDKKYTPRELWYVVQNGINKAHNGQMEVVLALWNAGYIK